MKLIVDKSVRFANMRAHTATHLLHAELQKIFPDTKQAGSWVGEDELRFDFSADRMLSSIEIANIEKNINSIIYDSLDVSVQKMTYAEAISTGAKAFFEDKYGDNVRVVSIGGDVSVELCGGTHIANTSHIGSFVFDAQEAVASGVKRVSAFVGSRVIDHIHTKNKILDSLVFDLGLKSYSQIQDKISKSLQDYKSLQDKVVGLESKIINDVLSTIKTNTDFDMGSFSFDVMYDIDKNNILSSLDFKIIIAQAKNILTDGVFLFQKSNGSFAIISHKSGVSAKDIATELGRNGGGNHDFFQGKIKNNKK